MPLTKGSGQSTISKNIAELIRSGKFTQQQSAAIAYREAGEAKDAPLIQAAGTIFLTPSGTALWVKGAGKNGFSGEWQFPGGKVEAGETAAQAAKREVGEELQCFPEGEAVELHHAVTERSVDYTTMLHGVRGEFPVQLTDEHTSWAWAPLDDPPQPVHPGIAKMLEEIRGAGAQDAEEAEDDPLATGANSAVPVGARRKVGAQDAIALDAATANRTKSQDGHLHVASSVVSAAQVNDYRGDEIPGWRELGLQADRVYALLRDPVELEKAVPSLHGKPLVIVHRAQTADDHDREITVGSVSNPTWEYPNVKAEIAVWDGEAIELIESGEQADVSAGYFYVPVMDPGEFNGTAFSGRMTKIGFNHLAIVKIGRVIGAMIGDSEDSLEWTLIERALLDLAA